MKSLLFPIINFSIFCGILFYVLRKPVKNLFQSRSDEIKKNIEDAKVAYLQSKENFDSASIKIQNLENEKKSLESDTERQVEMLKAKTKEAMESWILKMKAEYEQRSQDELKRVVDELKKEVAGRIIALSEKIIREKLTQATHQELVQGVVSEVLKNEKNIRKEASWQNESPNAMPERS